MKGKIPKILSVALALVLVLSFSLVMAVPVSADVSSATVTVVETTKGVIAEYTIEFTTTEALVATNTITITFPDDTVVAVTPTGTVNDVDIVTVVGNSGDRTVVITIPDVTVAAAETVTLVLATGITNPTNAGWYTLDVHTSAEDTDVTSKYYAIGDVGIRVVDSEDTVLDIVADGGSFYAHVTDGEGDDIPVWNTHPAMVDTLEVTVNTYDGATNGTPTSTATYTATETDKDTGEFWTGAIDTGDLNVRPGYKLEVYPSEASASTAGEAYVTAEISFDKSYYDVNETMTITLQDDIWNLDAAVIDTPDDIGTCTIETTISGENINIEAGWAETGVDTGVFTKSFKPSDVDFGFVPGDTMEVIYTNDLGSAPTGIVKATAHVLMYSTSSVKFDKGTYAVTATSATITVTDADKNTNTGAEDVISGADVLVVENLATGYSVSLSSLTENAINTGEFTGTVNFGTDTGELAINDGDQLQATYTDPATPADVSTVTAAVGYTVFLYEADGTLDSSHTTIQDAIDAFETGTGWTVKVSEAYNSTDETFPIDINKEGLTVESVAGAASTIIDCEGTFNGIEITANDVTFDGFTVKDASGYAIQVSGADAIVKYNEITSATGYPMVYVISGATGTTLSNNTLDIYTTMIVSGVSTITLSDNTFGAGINLQGGALMEAIDIIDNIIIGSEYVGIKFEAGSFGDILIQGNTISETTVGDAQDAAIAFRDEVGDVTNVTIIGNDITDNEDAGIRIGDVDWGTGNAIKFNNITGNEDYGIDAGTITVNATHNWWGTSDPSADTFSGSVTYEPCLGASIVRGAVAFAYNTDSLDAETAVGVKVSGVVATGNAEIGAAVYTDNPKAEFTAVENGFLDVYVVPDAIGADDEIIVKFYAADIDADSVVYVWNELYGEWMECTLQDYSSWGGYIYVIIHAEANTTAPTIPTIEALAGLPFAISGEAAAEDPWDYDANEDGVIDKSEAVAAVWDYFDGLITKDLAIAVLWLYFG